MRRTITVLLAALPLLFAACAGGSEALPAASTPPSTAPDATASRSTSTGVGVASTGGSTAAKATDSQPGALKQIEAARRAAEVTFAQRTLHYDFAFSIAGIPNLPGVLSITGDGASDLVSGRSHMRLDFSSFFEALRYELAPDEAAELDAMFGDGLMEVVSDGATTYIYWPFMSEALGVQTSWLSMAAPAGAVPLEGLKGGGVENAFAYGPDGFLTLLKLLDSFEEVGTEDMRGVPTTHWVGTLSFERLLDLGDSTLRDQYEWQYQQLGLLDSALPLEVWVDADGLTRRFLMDLDLGVFDPSAAGARFQYRYDFYDFGVPVDVTLPPASEVTDVTELLGGNFALQ